MAKETYKDQLIKNLLTEQKTEKENQKELIDKNPPNLVGTE